METCERCGLPFAEKANDLSRYDEKCFTRFPTAANADGCRWAREKRQKLLAEKMVAEALADARAAGYAEAIEKLTTWQFRDESELEGESFAIFDGFGGRRGEVYRNVNDKWYCSPTLGREFETMEEARTALCARVADEINNTR